MSSRTKQIGLIGEQVIISEFVKNGIEVLVPIGDNSPYDIVINHKGKFIKIQVKTTEFVKNDVMIFSTNITNPFKKTSRLYRDDEIDFFGLYCIENGYVGLLPVSDCTAKETKIRLVRSKNNQRSKVKMADDYSFSNIITQL